MAPLRYAAKFDPFISFPWIAPPPSTLAQSKERKGSNFAIWQPCRNSEAAQHFVIAAAAKKDEVHNEHAYEATFNAAVAYRYDRVSG